MKVRYDIYEAKGGELYRHAWRLSWASVDALPGAFWSLVLWVVTVILGVGPLWLCVGIATWFVAWC